MSNGSQPDFLEPPVRADGPIRLVDPDPNLPDLEAAGYVLQFREPDWYEHRFLRDHNPDVQVHVFTAGSPEVERMLLFRDRLRARHEERELYERTKRELAARRWDYPGLRRREVVGSRRDHFPSPR
jgi:GrpB-like predicted nucleotidyltransferase (UPF0157 family)